MKPHCDRHLEEAACQAKRQTGKRTIWYEMKNVFSHDLELRFDLAPLEPRHYMDLLTRTFGPLQILQNHRLVFDGARQEKMISLVELAERAVRWMRGDDTCLFYGATDDPDLAFFVFDQLDGEWSIRSEVWPWAVTGNSIDLIPMKELMGKFVIALRSEVYAKWEIDCTDTLMGLEPDYWFSPVPKASALAPRVIQELYRRNAGHDD